MKNKDFTKDEYFIKCCKAVEIEPRIRQASKFQNRQGLAYKKGRELVNQ